MEEIVQEVIVSVHSQSHTLNLMVFLISQFCEFLGSEYEKMTFADVSNDNKRLWWEDDDDNEIFKDPKKRCLSPPLRTSSELFNDVLCSSPPRPEPVGYATVLSSTQPVTPRPEPPPPVIRSVQPPPVLRSVQPPPVLRSVQPPPVLRSVPPPVFSSTTMPVSGISTSSTSTRTSSITTVSISGPPQTQAPHPVFQGRSKTGNACIVCKKCRGTSFNIVRSFCAECNRADGGVIECIACSAIRCARCFNNTHHVSQRAVSLNQSLNCPICPGEIVTYSGMRAHWKTNKHYEAMLECKVPARYCSLRCTQQTPYLRFWVPFSEQQGPIMLPSNLWPRGVCFECGGLVALNSPIVSTNSRI